MRQPMMDDELMHFGIKGMHWGIRRYQNPDGSLTSAGEARYGSKKRGFIQKRKDKKRMAAVRAAKQKKENHVYDEPYSKTRSLSDKDLNDRINRLQKEKQYKDLMDQTRNAGQKFVQDILKDAGKKVATAALIKVGNHYVNKILDKKVFKTTTKTAAKATKEATKDASKTVKDAVKTSKGLKPEDITPEMKRLVNTLTKKK